MKANRHTTAYESEMWLPFERINVKRFRSVQVFDEYFGVAARESADHDVAVILIGPIEIIGDPVNCQTLSALSTQLQL